MKESLGLQRVRREVEKGLTRLVASPLPHESARYADSLPELDTVLVRMGLDRCETPEGITFQGCGGGRRVIRKRIGSD